jgi:LAO/AO transport system kinase
MPGLEKTALDRRALGRALSFVANVQASSMFKELGEPSGTSAQRIGLTGAPGVGKSTLAGRLAMERLRGRRLGVLAIDPSSPKTGGAILGDRIRMDDLEGSENLFIRSFGSRSAYDGLTDNLPELLDTMDQFGFDEVIVETVGVGQVELAARTHMDTLVLVIPPDAGDVVQAMKAGITEIADIFVVNKSDIASSLKMATEIKRIVALTHPHGAVGWVPPVVLTSQARPESIVDLSVQVDRHIEWLQSSGEQAERVLARRKYRLHRWFERRVRAIVDAESAAFFDLPPGQQVAGLLGKIPTR